MNKIAFYSGIGLIILYLFAVIWKPFGEPIKWIWFLIILAGVVLGILGSLQKSKEAKK